MGKIIPYRRDEHNAKRRLLLYGIYGIGYVLTSGSKHLSLQSKKATFLDFFALDKTKVIALEIAWPPEKPAF